MSMARRSLSPRDAMERWLDRQRIDKTGQTILTYYHRLKLFAEWHGREGADEMGDLDRWLLEGHVTHRQSNDPVTATMKDKRITLRKFLRYCEDTGVVDDGIAKSISIPKVPPKEQPSKIKLAADDAAALLILSAVTLWNDSAAWGTEIYYGPTADSITDCRGDSSVYGSCAVELSESCVSKSIILLPTV